MLSDVARALFHRPVTERYPFERHAAPERLRGMLHFDPERCTGCALCVKDCPAAALELITLDKASKRFVLRYHVDRCTFCAQCVQSCKHDCLRLTDGSFELAARDKDAFTLSYGKDADVAAVMAGPAGKGADTAKPT